MKSLIKTNRLSIIGFVSGLLALLSLGLYWVLFSQAFPSSLEPANRVIITIMDLSVSFRNLCALTALITGIFRLREIKKKGGIERGKTLAWVGIILGAAWILFGLLTSITFLLAKILN